MNNVPCQDEGCLVCAVLGPPTIIRIPIRKADGAMVWMYMKQDRAKELGLLDDEGRLRGRVEEVADGPQA